MLKNRYVKDNLINKKYIKSEHYLRAKAIVMSTEKEIPAL